MTTHKHIDRICVAGIILALIIAILFSCGEKLGIQKVTDEDAERTSSSQYFTANDLSSADTDFSDAIRITLAGDTASIGGSGGYVKENEVHITRSGYYTVSGSSETMKLIVDAEDNSKVWIELDGVSLSCSDDACFQIENADKVFLILKEGTENSFAGGASFSEEAVSAGRDGTLFARDDITIAGTGSLTVTSLSTHAVVSNDDCVITGGTVIINSAKDGIHANNSIRICNASLSVTSEDEGMQTDEPESYIYLESGTFTIHSKTDAIKSAGDITIDGGTFAIEAEDDGIRSDTAVTIHDGTIAINECYEGIEAKTIEIAGGDITILPQDDGINANGGSGGFGGNGGFGNRMGREAFGTDSENQTSESGQMMNQENSTEGTGPERPESGSFPENGELPAEAQDAGEKASDPESGENASAEEETWVKISGGKITIINDSGTDADGIDSNGSVYITGGEIRVSLNGNGTNNAVDFGSESGGVALISGGILIASASSNMAESFDGESEQASVMYNVSGTMEAGTVMTLKDSEGNVLLQETIPCSFSSITFSCPEMKVGSTYTLSFNDTEETITLESVSSTFGSAQAAMSGGPMHSGRMERPENTASSEEGGFSETGELPASGDFPQDGNMPEMGGFPGNGEMPQGGFHQRPGQNSSAEDSGGETERPQFGGGPGGGEMMEAAEGTEEKNPPAEQESMNGARPSAADDSLSQNTQETETAEPVNEGQAWIMIGVSFAALMLGILAVRMIRGRYISS